MAEERGEAEAFAQSSNIKLIDGSVRVIIECVPGQAEAAAEAADALGIVELVTGSGLVQAVVPITSLIALADEGSIHFIRLPAYSVPATSN